MFVRDENGNFRRPFFCRGTTMVPSRVAIRFFPVLESRLHRFTFDVLLDRKGVWGAMGTRESLTRAWRNVVSGSMSQLGLVTSTGMGGVTILGDRTLRADHC
jgi:hypothetical protein